MCLYFDSIIPNHNAFSSCNNIAAHSSHGNAHIRFSHRRRIIDTISDHANIISKLLELP